MVLYIFTSPHFKGRVGIWICPCPSVCLSETFCGKCGNVAGICVLGYGHISIILLSLLYKVCILQVLLFFIRGLARQLSAFNSLKVQGEFFICRQSSPSKTPAGWPGSILVTNADNFWLLQDKSYI